MHYGSAGLSPTSLGADWTIIGLQGGRTIAEYTPGTVADLIASPGSLTFTNADHLGGASTSSDVVTTQHDDSTQDSWWGGTYDCETDMIRIPRFPGAYVEVELHQAGPDAASMDNDESMGTIMDIADPPAGAQYSALHMLKSGGAFYLQHTYNRHAAAEGADSSLNAEDAAKFATGYWLRLVISPAGGVTWGYKRGAASSRPAITDYAWLAEVTGVLKATDVQIGIGGKNQSNDATPSQQRLARTGLRVIYDARSTI